MNWRSDALLEKKNGPSTTWEVGLKDTTKPTGCNKIRSFGSCGKKPGTAKHMVEKQVTLK